MPAAAARAARSITVICGDLASDELYRHPAFDDVTPVVHAAACTSFRTRRAARRTNVDATKRLADRMQAAPKLARFLHVSTAYCCGDRPNPVVHEDDAPCEGHGRVNE